MDNFKINTYFKIIFLISIVSLISAYFIEFILGHQPCNLCLIERIPYGLSLILITVNFMLKKKEKIFIFLLILIFIFSFFISFYHFGIEQGFFQESPICEINTTKDVLSKEELLKQLSERTISCKDVTFMIFGLSLTSINVILSLMITTFLIKIFFTYEKN